MLTTLFTCFRCALRVVFKVPAALLPAFTACFRCTLFIFCKVS